MQCNRQLQDVGKNFCQTDSMADHHPSGKSKISVTSFAARCITRPSWSPMPSPLPYCPPPILLPSGSAPLDELQQLVQSGSLHLHGWGSSSSDLVFSSKRNIYKFQKKQSCMYSMIYFTSVQIFNAKYNTFWATHKIDKSWKSETTYCSLYSDICFKKKKLYSDIYICYFCVPQNIKYFVVRF